MMTKTIEDYMNDPRILEDKSIMEAHPCIREIYAARLRMQDEIALIGVDKHYEQLEAKVVKMGFKLAPVTQYSPLEDE